MLNVPKFHPFNLRVFSWRHMSLHSYHSKSHHHSQSTTFQSGLRTTPTSTLRNDGTKHTMRKSPYLVSLIFLLAATTLTILNIYVSFLAAGKRRLDV